MYYGRLLANSLRIQIGEFLQKNEFQADLHQVIRDRENGIASFVIQLELSSFRQQRMESSRKKRFKVPPYKNSFQREASDNFAK